MFALTLPCPILLLDDTVDTLKKDKISNLPEQYLTCDIYKRQTAGKLTTSSLPISKGCIKQIGLYWSSEADSKPRKAREKAQEGPEILS